MTINTLGKNRQRTVVSRQTVSIDFASYEQVAVGSSSARTTAPVNASKIALWSAVQFRLAGGDVTVDAVAGSPLFPANQFLIIDWIPGQYLATLYNGSDTGTLQIIGVY